MPTICFPSLTHRRAHRRVRWLGIALTCLWLTGPLTAGAEPGVPGSTSAVPENEIQAAIDVFNNYNTAIQENFASMQADIESTYRQYQRIAEQEYLKYEQQILTYWPDAQISTKTKWVEYAPDYQSRQTVDFENEEITIDIITTSNDDADIDRMFTRRLQEMITENQQAAFERDQLAQGIEDKIRQTSSENNLGQIKTGRPDADPILADMLTGKANPSAQEIQQVAARLKSRGAITRQQTDTPGQQIVRLRVALPSNAMKRKAALYQDEIDRFARQRGLTDALVLAVIHTESAFNPMARSHVPAYGLMQIVPQSAGRDVSQALYGQPLLLSPSYLYNGTNNINVGTTYLYLLYYKYLKEITDSASRLYCAIAAYNTGPGNVARAFTGTRDVSHAAGIINQMAPADVYRHLVNNLPYEETRDYLQRVAKRMEFYQQM